MNASDRDNEGQALDLEQYAKAGKPIPKGCKLFRIRIDGEKYLVQQAALTGRELLYLADKDPNDFRVLFIACGGKETEIGLDVNFSFLDPGIERFITEKRESGITIIVNGRKKTVEAKSLTFDEIVALAFENPPTGQFICFTITYRRGPDDCREGTLAEGESVRIKEGMIFNVTATDKS